MAECGPARGYGACRIGGRRSAALGIPPRARLAQGPVLNLQSGWQTGSGHDLEPGRASPWNGTERGAYARQLTPRSPIKGGKRDGETEPKLRPRRGERATAE